MNFRSIDWLPIGLICTAVILGPLCLGGTGAWSRLGLEAVSVLAVVHCAITGRLGARPAAAPLLVCGVLLLQLIPLPDRFLMTMAPLSAGAWKVAAEGATGTAGCIAVDPGEMLVGLRRMLVGLASIVAITALAREPKSRLAMRGALMISGLLVLGLGILFPVQFKEKVLLGFIDLKGPLEFWRSPVPAPVQTAGWAYLEWATIGDRRFLTDLKLVGDGFGPYVSSNEFAAGVYLTFPAVLAMAARMAKRRLSVALRYVVLIVLLGGALWVVGGVAQSRAGCASLAFGGMVFFTLMAERPTTRTAWRIATAFTAITLIGFTVLFHGHLDAIIGWWPDEWRNRLASLQGDGRVTASKVAMRMFSASPLLGTGLGSYGGLYPRMTDGNQVWYFAHNDYAQLLAETGLVGLALVAGAAAIATLAYRRFLTIHHPGDRLEPSVAWSGLAALAIHSAFDWNLHVPANAFLACVLVSLALASALPEDAALSCRRFPSISGWVAPRIPGYALAAACIASLVLLARDASSDTAALALRKALATAQVAVQQPERPSAVQQLLVAVAVAERSAARDNRNAQLAVLLGQANLRLAGPDGADGPNRTFAAAASYWFRIASMRSATIRGLPEPVPKPPQPRS
jgi:hypothetical protein